MQLHNQKVRGVIHFKCYYAKLYRRGAQTDELLLFNLQTPNENPAKGINDFSIWIFFSFETKTYRKSPYPIKFLEAENSIKNR